MNIITDALASACHTDPCKDKWLVAPSFQAGTQWLQSLALNGYPALNMRVMTPALLATTFAEPLLQQRKLTVASSTMTLLWTISAWQSCQPQFQYFTETEPSLTLYQTAANTLEELRLAGIDLSSVTRADFETDEKGHDLQLLATEYTRLLHQHQAADIAAIYTLACEALASGAATLDANVLVYYLDHPPVAPHEQRLLAALPPPQMIALPDDAHGAYSATISCYRAVGERNEIREVFRRCLKDGTPFDEVEILYTDSAYTVQLAELAEQYQTERNTPLCLTLAEGLPVRVTRPGRLLQAWLNWIDADCPQSQLIRMLQEKLLVLPASVDLEQISSAALARALRTLPIGGGVDRYLPAITAELRTLELQVTTPASDDEETDPAILEERHAIIVRRCQRMQALYATLAPLITISQFPGGASDIMASALMLVSTVAYCAHQRDNAARLALTEQFTEIQQQAPGLNGVMIRKYLTGLLDSVHVGAESPQPGRLHVASLLSGGYSGRAHTYILGISDDRFPGIPRQDPLLLDHERSRISPELPTSVSRLQEKLDAFHALLARLRGQITLSYCCREMQENREVFPSPLLLAIMRTLQGTAHLDLPTFLATTQIVGHVPTDQAACLDQTDWWLSLAIKPGVCITPATLISHRSFLHAGYIAATQRQQIKFTEFDGYVPLAGQASDPRHAHTKPVSPSALETYGKCPMKYFFSRVLRIKPPDEFGVDANVWLDAAQFGTLLHTLFEAYFHELLGQWPATLIPAAEELRITRIMNDLVRDTRAAIPPPSEAVFRRQYRDIADAARLFVQEECDYCRQAKPLYLEAAIGCTPKGGHTTPLDDPAPVTITLPGGAVIRFAGCIDRIDQHISAPVPTFTLWDYKSGSTWAFSDGNQRPALPFREGRLLQPVMYLAMALARLKALHGPTVTVDSIGYYFPTLKGKAERISWTPSQLDKGLQIIEHLCDGLAAGAFPASNNAEDCGFCEYAVACGQPCTHTARKLAEGTDTPLNAMRTLRRIP